MKSMGKKFQKPDKSDNRFLSQEQIPTAGIHGYDPNELAYIDIGQ